VGDANAILGFTAVLTAGGTPTASDDGAVTFLFVFAMWTNYQHYTVSKKSSFLFLNNSVKN